MTMLTRGVVSLLVFCLALFASLGYSQERELGNRLGGVASVGSILSNLRGGDAADASAMGSWQSFPTPAPKRIQPKQNPGTQCAIQTFGRCKSGQYCKGISYDKYQCTKCPANKKCTGDGKMGPP